ncbi:MAG TPA: J domain-containing protein [Kamptonema sp.]|nr:J domain-containing protein [Kamptonema sp.]
MPRQTHLASTYYALLGVQPSASDREIRRSYRELSKLYHPDTTNLPRGIAIAKFQQLNEAYATLSNPERRLAYDRFIDYSRLNLIQPPSNLNHPLSNSPSKNSDSASLDPTDRPLSSGEIFVLFILGLTLLGCLGIAIAIALIRPEVTTH